jgi:hypothetical protein
VQWEKWHAEHRCNFGIVMGPSNCIALDLDKAKDADIWTKFCAVWTARGLAVLTPQFQSARGGWHVLVKAPAGFDLSTLAQRPLIPNVDTRIGNGYIVAPGSFYDGKPKGEESGWYQMVADAPAPHDDPAVFAVLAEVLGNKAATDDAEPESYDLPDIDARARFLIPTGFSTTKRPGTNRFGRLSVRSVLLVGRSRRQSATRTINTAFRKCGAARTQNGQAGSRAQP